MTERDHRRQETHAGAGVGDEHVRMIGGDDSVGRRPADADLRRCPIRVDVKAEPSQAFHHHFGIFALQCAIENRVEFADAVSAASTSARFVMLFDPGTQTAACGTFVSG